LGNIVSNATPIIYLAKIGRLHLLERLYENIIVPKTLQAQLISNEYPEVSVIKEAFRRGWLETKELDGEDLDFLNRHLVDVAGIHEGEREAIAIAYNKHLPLIIDENERTGRRVAKVWGIEVKGTLRVVIEAYEKDIIAYDEAKEAFTQLLARNFRVSAEIYETALNILERVRREKR